MRHFDLRLRYWAFRQFLYERKTHPKDSEDAADFALARRVLLARSVLRGHLDDRCFVSMEADFPELGKPRILADDDAVIRIAGRHLERYRLMGRERSGVIEGYLLAQRAHLAACERCRRFVCAAVRKDVSEERQIRRLLDSLGPGARQELAEEFAPEIVRRRGDTTLN
ncbi:MAG: hypothetical protein RL272_1217 [Candidatus Parcubacteria bacterium]|jgi:hypothetical protein